MTHTKEQAEKRVKDNIGSLEALCKEAICTADLNLMLAMGFPEGASRRICQIIIEEAKSLGVTDLMEHYNRSLEGKSNIINTIVRRKHKVYFATRANLHPLVALEHFSSGQKNTPDICSALYQRSIKQAAEMKKNRQEALLGKELKRLAKQDTWLDYEGAGCYESDGEDWEFPNGNTGYTGGDNTCGVI